MLLKQRSLRGTIIETTSPLHNVGDFVELSPSSFSVIKPAADITPIGTEATTEMMEQMEKRNNRYRLAFLLAFLLLLGLVIAAFLYNRGATQDVRQPVTGLAVIDEQYIVLNPPNFTTQPGNDDVIKMYVINTLPVNVIGLTVTNNLLDGSGILSSKNQHSTRDADNLLEHPVGYVLCPPYFASNTIDVLKPGQTVVCVGIYQLTSADIIAQYITSITNVTGFIQTNGYLAFASDRSVIDLFRIPLTNVIFNVTTLGNQISGPTGMMGLNGTTGPTGTTGATGSSGTSGSTGSRGETGTTGATGTSGSTGDTGPSGSSGATGATGSTGGSGFSGSSGATGATGGLGTSGSSGATGATGGLGTSGSSGATGATGATGGLGTSGSSGATGATGGLGPSGSSGATGAAGGTGPASSGFGDDAAYIEAYDGNSPTPVDITGTFGTWTNVCQLITTTTHVGTSYCSPNSGTQGAYYIGFYIEVWPNSGPSNTDAMVRVTVDGAATFMANPTQDYNNGAGGGATNGYFTITGFRVYCLTAAMHTINVDVQNTRNNGSPESKARRCRINLFRYTM